MDGQLGSQREALFLGMWQVSQASEAPPFALAILTYGSLPESEERC